MPHPLTNRERPYSPECFHGMHSACAGCDGCLCHYEHAEEYDPINDDRLNDPEGD